MGLKQTQPMKPCSPHEPKPPHKEHHPTPLWSLHASHNVMTSLSCSPSKTRGWPWEWLLCQHPKPSSELTAQMMPQVALTRPTSYPRNTKPPTRLFRVSDGSGCVDRANKLATLATPSYHPYDSEWLMTQAALKKPTNSLPSQHQVATPMKLKYQHLKSCRRGQQTFYPRNTNPPPLR
jgi:hypothetical protein